MSLQYALPLTRSDRQFLARIARGRGGPPRPAVWQAVRARALLKCDAGPAGAGETDAAVAAALDVAAGSVGRGRRQAVAEGPAAVTVRRGPARAKRISGSGPHPRRRPAMRAGPCACGPARGPRAGSDPGSATKPCAAR